MLALALSVWVGLSGSAAENSTVVDSFSRTDMVSKEILRSKISSPHGVSMRGQHLLLSTHTQYAITSSGKFAEEGLLFVDLSTLLCEQERGARMITVGGRGATLLDAQRDALSSLSLYGRVSSQTDRSNGEVAVRTISRSLYVGVYVMKAFLDADDMFHIVLSAYVSR